MLSIFGGYKSDGIPGGALGLLIGLGMGLLNGRIGFWLMYILHQSHLDRVMRWQIRAPLLFLVLLAWIVISSLVAEGITHYAIRAWTASQAKTA